VIKYLGSKRRLVPLIERLALASGARSALDLFTGTTRVAQALKGRGLEVTAIDAARYAEVFARCYIEIDATRLPSEELDEAILHLAALPGRPGYVTDTFCRRARFFQPFNGARIDAIRDAIETDFSNHRLYPVLLTSLIEAADRVDSTTGVQMAYVKTWAPRSYRPLELRPPRLLPGGGRAVRGDVTEVTGSLGSFDLAYLDPPYNQHRYFTNYHVWETLVAWDAPAHYGVACKRADARLPSTRSAFDSKKTMPAALADVVRAIDAALLVLSYNDESWLSLEELVAMCAERGRVAVMAVDSARYVGARIGIHDPKGRRVGSVGRLRNREYLVVSGSPSVVEAAVAGCPVGRDPHLPEGARWLATPA
jgi:adenine-specific DNA-methyltransferase